MKIYEAVVAGAERKAFRYLYQARRYAKENDAGAGWYIDRVEVGKPDLDLLLNVINSNGGCYALTRQTIEGSTKI